MADDLPIRLERADGIAVLTLCRPEQKNVMTHAWIAALQSHADALHEDTDLRCVLLQHEGTVFSVGADVKEMAAQQDRLVEHLDSLITPVHHALLRLLSLPAPVVCALHGTAAGGGVSLALGCDLLVAARSSRLVIAYPQLGTTPDAGLSHALIERLGAQRALKEFLLSDTIDMARAQELGLVHEVVDDSEAQAAARRIVERIAALPAIAAKRLFLHGRLDVLAQRLDRERESFLRCAAASDFRERVMAFSRGRRG
jgi:2-(1,2-epoxy-1,2-dihydrophenyl)acetyl-CoA isomerase